MVTRTYKNMQLKLVRPVRASPKVLLQAYRDFLRERGLPLREKAAVKAGSAGAAPASGH